MLSSKTTPKRAEKKKEIRESMLRYANRVGNGKLSVCPEFVDAVAQLYSKEFLMLVAKINGLPFSKTKPELVRMLLDYDWNPPSEIEVKQLVKKAHDTFNAGRPLTTLRFLHHPKARPAKNGAEPLSGVAGSSESHPRARDPSSVTGSIGSVSSSPTTSSSTSPSSSSSVCSSSSSASIMLNPDIDGMLGQESGSGDQDGEDEKTGLVDEKTVNTGLVSSFGPGLDQRSLLDQPEGESVLGGQDGLGWLRAALEQEQGVEDGLLQGDDVDQLRYAGWEEELDISV